MNVDTARGVGGDYSAFTVVDITNVPYKLAAKYRNNKIAPMLYPNVINKVARDFNEAHVLIEINDIGQQVADILHSELEYDNILTTANDANKQYLSPGFGKTTQMGVRMTKQVKRQGCFTLKSLMEEKKLLLFDADTISEFSTFIEKRGTWMADEGYYDDLVMTLVMFAWVTSNTYFRDLTDIDIRRKLYDSQMKQIEEELTPFGVISSGLEEETFVDSGDLWTVDTASEKRGWLL
jgi:hypothetical protein